MAALPAEQAVPLGRSMIDAAEQEPLDELARFIKAYGQRNISVASELVPEAQS